MKTLFLLLLLVACGAKKDKAETKTPAWDFEIMQELDGREPMLIVGDSISMGYTPWLQNVYPEFQVIHNTSNASHSKNGKDNIDIWLAHAPTWKVCTLNHGIHDMRLFNAVTIEDYEDNLIYEINAMSAVCERIVFMTTTFIPANVANIVGGLPTEYNRLDEFNARAVSVMQSLGVEVCDLNTYSKTIKPLYKEAAAGTNLHFTPEGSRLLAKKIKACLNI